MEFQISKNIPPTGVADIITWGLLFDEYQKSVGVNSSASGIFPFFDLPSDYEIKVGDSNILVSIIEIMLEELSSEYTEFKDSYEKNGIFDKNKSDIIKGYQRKNMIDQSGRIDRNTWNRLAEDFNLIIRKNK